MASTDPSPAHADRPVADVHDIRALTATGPIRVLPASGPAHRLHDPRRPLLP